MLADNGYQTIIIVGGDSALNRALNGLLSLSDDVRERTAIGVIPNGRGNDFASFWGFDEENDAQTIKWLKARRIKQVDVGEISYTVGGEARRHFFLNCVNVGLVANIMKLKFKTRRIFGLTTLTYFTSMIGLLFQRMETKMKLKINEETIDRKVMSVCVGNSRGYGQTPNAVPYNGMLDVSIISYPRGAPAARRSLDALHRQIPKPQERALLPNTTQNPLPRHTQSIRQHRRHSPPRRSLTFHHQSTPRIRQPDYRISPLPHPANLSQLLLLKNLNLTAIHGHEPLRGESRECADGVGGCHI